MSKTNVGALDGDPFSQANGSNAHWQVVRVSHGGAAGARGFIWEEGPDGEGVMTDLNDLIDLGPDEVFELAHDLNDSGRIAGRLHNRTTNERTAVVLIPRAK